MKCERTLWLQGTDRQCGQTVATRHWLDYTGQPHTACPRHISGMLRRHPESLATHDGEHGRLRLTTPWARGAFGPNDVVETEALIPPGWTISVSVSGDRRSVILSAIDPDGVSAIRWDHHRLSAAVTAAQEMARGLVEPEQNDPITAAKAWTEAEARLAWGDR